MRTLSVSLALAACLVGSALGAPQAIPAIQQPLLEQQQRQDDVRPEEAAASRGDDSATHRYRTKAKARPLKGRFLHITDLHPDPFYRAGADPEDEACHRKSGEAGYYGAVRTDCDSPLALVNATFDWIAAHVKDEIDFVIWTGDSARHDNDERIPRDRDQVTGLNTFAVAKFREVFGKGDDDEDRDDDDPTNDMTVPIVPTFGNNDILPHNVFFPGPNRWTRTYLNIWEAFIPEAQRHGFATGGWFFREVIPNHLAVFSLNSLYFFDHNSAVDGCANRHEPGYQQFEWLRIQLQFLRRRGMKAIITGHVPPARTSSKQSWDETCWQKYTLWMQQYRDVVVGSAWGHMNIDHFMLQDAADIDIALLSSCGGAREASSSSSSKGRQSVAGIDDDGEMTVQSSTDYLVDLRKQWKPLPRPPKGLAGDADTDADVNPLKSKKKKKKEREKYFKKIGGEYGERYSLGLVSPSIVPNYFPTLRIMSYNISGLETADRLPDEDTDRPAPFGGVDDVSEYEYEDEVADGIGDADSDDATNTNTNKKKKKKKKKKKPHFKTPKGPSKSTPPGPAYSMQPLTWTGYQQLFANLTALQIADSTSTSTSKSTSSSKSKPKPHFAFALEYDTRNDSVYNLPDLTVRSYLRLAQRLGQYKPPKSKSTSKSTSKATDENDVASTQTSTSTMQALLQRVRGKSEEIVETLLGKKKKDKKKKKKEKKEEKRRKRNLPWLTFMNRAFVGAKELDAEKLDVHSTASAMASGTVSTDENALPLQMEL